MYGRSGVSLARRGKGGIDAKWTDGGARQSLDDGDGQYHLLVGAACARHPVDGSYTAFAASVAVLDRRDEQLLAGVFRRLGRLPCLESRFRPPALLGRNGVYHAGQTAVHPLFLRSEEHTSELQSLMRISYA